MKEDDLFFAVPTGARKILNVKDSKTNSIIPKERYVMRLRSCLSCRIILSDQQFYEKGCPNCTHLAMEFDRHKVNSCTTTSYKGMISMLKPELSWVARYNRITDVTPGCYAVSVSGDLMYDNRGYEDEY
ncbi:putative transcription elongation factor SPT4 [Cryptosporidium serpentis]|uniref:Transcription elongation factor SPT4, putative n=1 Tax=Cryptosporidium muris (strain RN66) TaxID=441375 RepID=B6AHA6_CRYMR|nr:transcription elongation factor SPT4, putative [Cryptosporidium muris RN66]EEA07601.1 transcription elongation factor SPT4, putative [Cryptosporidium muris RN66]|eukprot:XP_002141950.1 transcription elongation factor SPT4 [Cryptosporidium muris RN66]